MSGVYVHEHNLYNIFSASPPCPLTTFPLTECPFQGLPSLTSSQFPHSTDYFFAILHALSPSTTGSQTSSWTVGHCILFYMLLTTITKSVPLSPSSSQADFSAVAVLGSSLWSELALPPWRNLHLQVDLLGFSRRSWLLCLSLKQ